MDFMQKTIIVIPCYNESGRLKEDQYNLLLQQPNLEVLFVNDGSSDNTEQKLNEFIKKTAHGARLLSLKVNSGKAEAVRQGMLKAINDGAAITGYLDADMATPVDDVLRLRDEAMKKRYSVILGSRVKLLGTTITRDPVRHYVGRVFATFASIILNLPVYDTQCGAKLFIVSGLLKDVLAEPFHSRWVFDVELIGRLLIGGRTSSPLTIDDFIEVPLNVWTDVKGTKISFADVIGVPMELIKISVHLRKRRRKLSE